MLYWSHYNDTVIKCPASVCLCVFAFWQGGLAVMLKHIDTAACLSITHGDTACCNIISVKHKLITTNTTQTETVNVVHRNCCDVVIDVIMQDSCLSRRKQLSSWEYLKILCTQKMQIFCLCYSSQDYSPEVEEMAQK